MPAYDTVPAEDSRIPEWIQETVYTRNTVNIAPHCEEYIRKVQAKLVQYKNAPAEYIQGTVLTAGCALLYYILYVDYCVCVTVHNYCLLL